ncbi:hypothetical protein C8P68_102658 [Mucilaginibacter yixingensis]|uniref:Uncharacterized protein n=2 Tax=Mucilaginibacter yixingensis TaxID=1295612 RepID=A0A2T5JDI3_9SPHI|nr:hypothetical protein C8P68_102658 [Mucilaginibacter yixingensis]
MCGIVNPKEIVLTLRMMLEMVPNAKFKGLREFYEINQIVIKKEVGTLSQCSDPTSTYEKQAHLEGHLI